MRYLTEQKHAPTPLKLFKQNKKQIENRKKRNFIEKLKFHRKWLLLLWKSSIITCLISNSSRTLQQIVKRVYCKRKKTKSQNINILLHLILEISHPTFSWYLLKNSLKKALLNKLCVQFGNSTPDINVFSRLHSGQINGLAVVIYQFILIKSSKTSYKSRQSYQEFE